VIPPTFQGRYSVRREKSGSEGRYRKTVTPPTTYPTKYSAVLDIANGPHTLRTYGTFPMDVHSKMCYIIILKSFCNLVNWKYFIMIVTN